MTQGMATLLHYRHCVHPMDGPGFAARLFCHKVARWLVIPAAFLGGIALFAEAVTEHAALAWMAWIGALLAGLLLLELLLVRSGWLGAAWLGTGTVSLMACLASWTRLLVGSRTVSWEPDAARPSVMRAPAEFLK